MISKIKMLGVASFKREATLETDKKVNLIYGLNGTGKSTLSNFLYDRDEIKYQQCSIAYEKSEKLLVYNQRFIQDNFSVSDPMRGIFSLSKENKDIDEKLRVCEAKLATKIGDEETVRAEIAAEKQRVHGEYTSATGETWKIKTQYTGGDRVLEFCLAGLKGKKETLFDHIAGLSKPDQKPPYDTAQIKADVDSILGESAKLNDPLALINFGEHDVETNTIFNDVIVGSKDSPVAGLIQELHNSDWVRTGLDYVRTPSTGEASICPFCQEQTITEAIAENIRSYFDESFTKSLGKISTLLATYRAAVSRLPSIEKFESNPFANARRDELQLLLEKLHEVASTNIRTIQSKESTPSRSVSLFSTRDAVKAINVLLEAINADIHRNNSQIQNREKERTRLKTDFWKLMRWDYDQTVARWQQQKAASKTTISNSMSKQENLLAEISRKQNEISTLQQSTVNIDGAVRNINTALSHLGISDFQILKHDEAYYRIVRSGESEAEFSSLSEGEKMIISFLYFCEFCKGKQSASEVTQKRIAVIDDPISSLSHIFIFNIGQLLKTDFFSSSIFDQVFVLTHSLYFFYELADTDHGRRKKHQKLFRLLKNSDGSQINEMKYEEIQNDYQSYWTIATDKNQPPALIANSMRNIIEYFFNFVQKTDFNNVFQKPELQENRYQSFCRYVNRESHSLGQNIFDIKEFDYDAFRDGFKLVFKVLGYPEHHEKMTKALSA